MTILNFHTDETSNVCVEYVNKINVQSSGRRSAHTSNPGHMGNLCLLFILFTAVLQLNKIRHFIAPHGVVEVPENNIDACQRRKTVSMTSFVNFLFFDFE